MRNLASTKNFVEFRDIGIYTFFEASRFGCCKTNFDATKVTYNKYSYAISGMSREMMKMEGRGRAECQNGEKRDIMVILGIVLMRIKPKKGIVPSPSL